MFILVSCQKEEDLESLLTVTLHDGTIIYVHPTDNADRIGWDEVGYFIGIADLPDTITEADALSDFNGESNTRAIVNQIGYGNYAAKKCDELEAYGFTDWFLPAAGELAALLDQLEINTWLDDIYWSSTEYNDESAWVVNRWKGWYDIEYSITPRVLAKFESYSQRCRCVRR
jgi:hypothetical protein